MVYDSFECLESLCMIILQLNSDVEPDWKWTSKKKPKQNKTKQKTKQNKTS